MEWRMIRKYGNLYLEGKYAGEEWHGWLFPTDAEKHDHWIWMPEFDVYRRNMSI